VYVVNPDSCPPSGGAQPQSLTPIRMPKGLVNGTGTRPPSLIRAAMSLQACSWGRTGPGNGFGSSSARKWGFGYHTGCTDRNLRLKSHVPTGMLRPWVEQVVLDVIAPTEGERSFARSQIATCKVTTTAPTRVVVRLTDGSVMVVTKESADRAGMPMTM